MTLCRQRNVATSSSGGKVLCLDCERHIPHPWQPPENRTWQPKAAPADPREPTASELSRMEEELERMGR